LVDIVSIRSFEILKSGARLRLSVQLTALVGDKAIRSLGDICPTSPLMVALIQV
jgi:hypothetical protein